MLAVVVSQAGAPTWRKTFAAREITIGRSMTNDLVLSSSEVSRQHARITVRFNVRYTLFDRGSSHGTRYGGQLVSNYVAVMPQVPIEIGPYTLTIERAQPSSWIRMRSSSSAMWSRSA
ncbi:MAG: FHA domain-containing protein [Deltaproteobacteria bacterium]|nr:FHA domain-containing protein [Deltaproteobacteria bacterium]